MPNRTRLQLLDVAAWPNLCEAFWKAARGRRSRPAVQDFAARLDDSLRAVQRGILEQTAPLGRWRAFDINDPKPRRILAPCFPDKVMHHALMNHLGPVLDRALIDDTFACRLGKGSLAAVHRALWATRRWPWYVKTDVRAYFASVGHQTVLEQVLVRRFKGEAVLALCARILERWPGPPGVGLPIGALTSQYFANSYLDVVDRLLRERLRVPGYVRYMDDLVWWCETRDEARTTYAAAKAAAQASRGLELKPPQIGRSANGVSLLGFRVFPGALRLNRRRRRRYSGARARWEAQYRSEEIDENELQRGYASAAAITAYADATAWRSEQLRRVPAVDVRNRLHGGGRQAPIGSSVAALGSTTPGTSVPRTGTGTSRATATTTWASACPERSPGWMSAIDQTAIEPSARAGEDPMGPGAGVAAAKPRRGPAFIAGAA